MEWLFPAMGSAGVVVWYSARADQGRTARAREWHDARTAWLLVMMAVGAGVVGAINPAFVSWESVSGLLSASSVLVIVGVGVGLVVISGEIDISVGSMYGVLAAVLAVLSSPSHLACPAWVCVPAVIGCGAAAGFVNGAITVGLLGGARVPSIVVTLGTMFGLGGVTQVIMGGAWVTDLPEELRVLGTGRALGVPISVWVGAGIVLGGWVLSRRTALGVWLYAAGDSARAATLARIRVDRVKLLAFTISGALVGVAAVVSVPQLSVVDAGLGAGLELSVVTAIVVGGVSILGGTGSLVGVGVAAVGLQAISSALVYLNLGLVAAYWEQAILGVCILVGVVGDRSAGEKREVAIVDSSVRRDVPAWPLGVALALVMFTAWRLHPEFLGIDVQGQVLSHIAEIALIAVPMTLVMLTGGIDLSVGSIVGLSAVVAGAMHERGHSSVVGGLSAVFTGVVCGAINGFLVTRTRVHPLVVTLATLALFLGAAHGASRGRVVSGFSPAWVELGAARVVGVPVVLVPAIVSAGLGAMALAWSVPGRRLRAVGVNAMAARYGGIGVERIKWGVYTLSGAGAGIAACIFIARFDAAKADVAHWLALNVITACVLGGVSLAGGRGGVGGAMLGVLLLHEVSMFMAWYYLPAEWSGILLCGVLIGSLLIREWTMGAERREG